MGVVLPGYCDEALDLIGVSWPNVDEDDYREMATSMREFADDIDTGALDAHAAVERMLSANEGAAVEAFMGHWGKVKDTHLKNLGEAARVLATALDGVAVVIEGAKLAAIVQLGILAAEIIAAVASSVVTLGLSALAGLAATQITRAAVKRILKEAAEAVVEEIISLAMGPVYEALGSMAGDLVIQAGSNALGTQNGIDLGQTANAGKDGFSAGADASKNQAGTFTLASAGGGSGGGGGGGGKFAMDEDEMEILATGLKNVGGGFDARSKDKLTRAKSRQNNTRGKDGLADAANGMLDKVLDGITQGLGTATKHVAETVPKGLRTMAKNHRDNDNDILNNLTGIGKGDRKDPSSPSTGTSVNSTGKGPGRGKARDQLGDGHPNNNTRGDAAVKDCGDPVDIATGRVFLRQTDITLPGTLPLVLTRKFESSYRAGRHIGPSWSSTVDQRLEIDEQGIVLVTENGLLLSYDIPGPGEHVLPAHGPRWPLTRTPQGDWAVHDPGTGHTRYFAETVQDPGHALLDEISDRNGNRITFDYDDRTGAPSSIRHSAGYHLKLTADDQGRITALHLAGAADDGTDQLVMSYAHDKNGNLTAVTNSSGIPTRFEYDTDHRLTAWIDTNESRYEYTYDHRSRCVSQGGTEGHLRYDYDYDRTDPATGHRTTAATNSLGNTTHYRINMRLQVIAETDPLGNTTRTGYDEFDRPLAVTDPLGRTTRLAYDEAGRLTTVTRPDGHRSAAAYNDLGLLTELTDPDGAVWQPTYDDRGNRTSLTDPSGATTHYTYDQRGHITSATDALGNTTHINCNETGLPITVTDPLGAVTRYGHDHFGRITSVTGPLGETSHQSWTVEGRPATRATPTGAVEQSTYDGEGNLIAQTDASGRTTRYEYGHFDLLAARTDPDGVRYEFSHDTELRPVRVTNPQGLTWTYEYDAVGRLVAETDFDGRTLSYAHNSAGQLTARTNALGQTTHYGHDVLGRILTKNTDGLITTYEYDPAGRLLKAAGPDATLLYRRDRLGRVISESCNGRTLAVAYDSLGRRIRRATPTGATSTWSYDAAGRPTALVTAGGTLDFEYDVAGREIARHVGKTVTLTHAWDPADRLTAQTVTGTGTGTIQSRAYTYLACGHLNAVDDHLNGQRAFDLDPVGRVIAVHAREWTERYAYDEAGNQTSAEWPTVHPGQEAVGSRVYSGTRITRAGQIRYEHDAQGRVVLRQKVRLSRKPDTWRYTWDADDRLTSVLTPDGVEWRYLYDPLGRRIAKQRLAEDGTVAEQTDFTWDSATLTEQTSTADGLPNPVTLTWDHDGLHPLAQTERITTADAPQQEIDQRFFAIVTDLVGTPNELIDESGQIAWRTRATLWGTTAWSTRSTAYTPLRFPGQYFDSESGLHYNFHRYYDPETARYTTPDPLGLNPAPNPVAYVDNPHIWADPLGLAPCYDVEPVPADKIPRLFHYTNQDGHDGIIGSNEMWPSQKEHNPKDARFGDGQYLTDIVPGTKTPGQLSHAFLRVPWAGSKFSHYVEIDATGLEIMRSVERPDVYVIPNNGKLDLSGRIISHGKS